MSHENQQQSNSEYAPDFVFKKDVDEAKRRELEARELEWAHTHLDIITEKNHAEYWARGFHIVHDLPLTGDEDQDDINLRVAKLDYGNENVYTGEAFDETEGRPLHLKPGKTIYVSPEGIEHYKRILAEQQAGDANPDTQQ